DRWQRIRALAHRKVGDIENQRGDIKQALQHALEAADINGALAAADPDNAQAAMNFVLSLRATADALSKSGDEPGALARYRQVIGMLDTLSNAVPADLFRRGQLADVLVTTGALLARQGSLVEARRMTSRGLVISRDLASRTAATPDDLSRYALT